MLRHDASTDTWVLLAPHRTGRPHHFRPPTAPRREAARPCPFCPGNEEETPPEIAAIRDAAGWRIRVVPNRFPALGRAAAVDAEPGRPPFLTAPGAGAHEVVIESPEHDRSSADLPLAHWTQLLSVLRQRHRALLHVEGVQAVTIFKNHGPAAGASLPHPHWQILATPVLPPDLARRVAMSRQHFERTGRSVQHDLLDAERRSGTRILAENSDFVSYLPFASRFPFEVRVQPVRRIGSFGDLADEALESLGEALRTSLARLAAALADPDYNLVVVSAPREAAASEHFGFHVQLLPRLVQPAGLELGTGLWINTMLPEIAAEELRKVGTETG